jgi:hypothetical protein
MRRTSFTKRIPGVATGAGKCAYKYVAGNYTSSTTVYAAANLISNGTPNLPVTFTSQDVVASAADTVSSAHITTTRNTETAMARSITCSALQIMELQRRSVRLPPLLWPAACRSVRRLKDAVSSSTHMAVLNLVQTIRGYKMQHAISSLECSRPPACTATRLTMWYS